VGTVDPFPRIPTLLPKGEETSSLIITQRCGDPVEIWCRFGG
jgi:hypothetical protein